MDLPMSYGIGYDEATGRYMQKPPECPDNCSCITLSVIIRDTLSHDFHPGIPAYEEASPDSTTN